MSKTKAEEKKTKGKSPNAYEINP